MFAKRFEEYRENYLETRLISQLSAFILSLLALFSLFNNLHAGYLFPEVVVRNNWQFFWIPIIFHIFASLFFGVRFVLLFFSSKKSFWLSQLFWFLGLVVLFAWSCYTEHSFYGFFHESFQISSSAAPTISEAPDTNFSNASQSLSFWGATYFFLSPIRQFFTFIISVFKRW